MYTGIDDVRDIHWRCKFSIYHDWRGPHQLRNSCFNKTDIQNLPVIYLSSDTPWVLPQETRAQTPQRQQVGQEWQELCCACRIVSSSCLEKRDFEAPRLYKGLYQLQLIGSGTQGQPPCHSLFIEKENVRGFTFGKSVTKLIVRYRFQVSEVVPGVPSGPNKVTTPFNWRDLSLWNIRVRRDTISYKSVPI